MTVAYCWLLNLKRLGTVSSQTWSIRSCRYSVVFPVTFPAAGLPAQQFIPYFYRIIQSGFNSRLSLRIQVYVHSDPPHAMLLLAFVFQGNHPNCLILSADDHFSENIYYTPLSSYHPYIHKHILMHHCTILCQNYHLKYSVHALILGDYEEQLIRYILLYWLLKLSSSSLYSVTINQIYLMSA